MKFDGVRRERIIASPQFDGRVFRNRATTRRQPQEQALSIIPEFLFGGARRRPKHPLPLSSPQEDWLRPVRSGLRTTWLGHSTVLLEVDGLRVLTDPVFGQRASPSALFGPKRFHPPPARLSELPPLDAVVISHDHFDHLCASTVAELARTRDVPIVTSLGVGARLERMGSRADESWSWIGESPAM